MNKDHVAEWNVKHSPMIPIKMFDAPRKAKGKDVDYEDSIGEGRVSNGLAEFCGTEEQLKEGERILLEYEHLRHRMVPVDEYPQLIRDFHDEWVEFKRENGLIDFTDMIERALAFVPSSPLRPWVIMVDEAQDLSKLEIALIRQWGKHASAIMLCGDPAQSLYGFRGADPDSVFDQPDVEESHRKVLSQSYRVPGEVLRIAKYWIETNINGMKLPHYRPRKDPFSDEPYEGLVRFHPHELSDPETIATELFYRLKEDDAKDQTYMVQAHSAYLLIGLMAKFRDFGIPYSNPWSLSRWMFNPLGSASGMPTSKKLVGGLTSCTDAENRIPLVYERFGKFLELFKAKGLFKHGKKKTALQVCDEISLRNESVSLAHIEEWFDLERDGNFMLDVWAGNQSCSDVVAWWAARADPKFAKQSQYLLKIVETFGSEALMSPPRVYVGTCHSFKGSEAGVVFVYPDLPPVAYRSWERWEGAEYEELVRTFYVAMTRTQQELVLCKASSARCVPFQRTFNEYPRAATAEP